MSLTATFARDLHAFAARPLDSATRNAAVALFVDGLAVAALGASQPGPRLLAGLAAETGAKPEATLVGQHLRSSAMQAARVNGASMHVLDFEPMWDPANHSLSTTLPAVLALAERAAGTESDTRPLGTRMLTALIAGIEAQARLRLSSGQFEPGELVFHPPSAVGPIGSAVACSIWLGLSQEQLVHAIGIAASRCGGLLANAGTMTKALHCGAAAEAGLEAALLAARGFTADLDAIGSPRGFATAFFRERFDPVALTAQRPTAHVVDPGPAFKLYPSQYGTHFAICAARDAHARLPAKAAIAKVRITAPHMPYVDRPAPASGLAGKFSFQYTAAVALLDGEVTVDSFTDARRFAPDVEALLRRIELVPDPSRLGRFSRMTLDMVVACEDGTTITTRCDGPPGIWGRPASPEALRHKAQNCLEAALGAARGAQVLTLASAVAEFRQGDLTALMKLLAEADPPSSEAAA